MLLIICFNICLLLFQQRSQYLDFNYWQKVPHLKYLYDNSQYVRKHHPIIISDQMLYAYAGGQYIKGVSPILINVDAPPLGKYLIGLSELLFNNESIVIVIFGVLSILAMYMLGKQILSSTALALLTPLLYSFEPLFKNQFIAVPVFDIMQLTYVVFCLYFFNKALKTKKYWLYFFITNIFLGFFISTKFFVSGLTLVAAMYGLLFLHKYWRPIIPYTVTFPISIVILLLTYIRVFSFKSYSFFSFLGIQKYVFLYHKSQLILPFSVWSLIFLDRWYVWFGNQPVIPDPLWSPMWPIITTFSLATITLYIFRKIKHNLQIEVLMIWAVIYLVFLSSGQIFSRYLFIVFPVLYIISIFGMKEIVLIKLERKKE